MVEKLLEWRDVLTDQLRRKKKTLTPDTFMFPGRFGNPIDPSNFRKRVLHELANELRLPKQTFQVIRRTIATHEELLRGSKATPPMRPKAAGGKKLAQSVPSVVVIHGSKAEPRVRSLDSLHSGKSGFATK